MENLGTYLIMAAEAVAAVAFGLFLTVKAVRTRKKAVAAVAVCIVLAGFIAAFLGIRSQYNAMMQQGVEEVALSEYYAIPEGRAMLIVDGEQDKDGAAYVDGCFYLDLGKADEMYDLRLFTEEDGLTLTYTGPDEVLDLVPGMRKYTANGEQMSSEKPFFRYIDGELYVSTDFLARRDICCTKRTDPEILMITYSDEPYLCATCLEDTPIRTKQDKTSPILKHVTQGEELRMIDGGGIRENGYIKVMSADGARGYILESKLTDTYYVEPQEYGSTIPQYTHLRSEDHIYMGWQLLYLKDSLSYLEQAVKKAPQMNVIAPTWFWMSGTDGSMISYANRDYTDRAHELGLSVWAVYKNDTQEGLFECSSGSHELLSSLETRRKLIARMMEDAAEYGFDGINIDFELLKKDTGPFFIEFLRELSVSCRRNGIVLSVDNYPPMSYNSYYDLSAQAEVVDHIIIMGYDEHTTGSAEAGSVSSLKWFKNVITSTLAKASPDAVIMGIPFYTRLWREKKGNLIVYDTPGMVEARDLIRGRDSVWLEDEAQYYVEYVKSGSTFRIWLEEERSVTAKVKAIRDAGITGVAAWKLGDEAEGIWAAIKKAMEK